ncbi:MAG: ABC transporter substrate-binding protein [Candidatus Aminicenantes bacterium]|nr:ABC transporter substrate-binding protein [Candidatus Aminicenantes bacterium]
MLDLRNKPIFLVLILAGLGLIVSFSFWLLEESHTKSSQASNPYEKMLAPRRKVSRIICIAPSVTEIVFALGCGKEVIGVSDFSTYPPQAKEKVRIGGMFNPNRERIIVLQPDLVIIQGKHDSVAKLCRKEGIRLLSVEIDTLKDIPEAIFSLGQELNAESQAAKLVKEVKDGLDAVKAKIQGLPTRKVFLTLAHTPGDLTGLMTTGPGTFLHELIEIAGGENIFADASGAYPQISKESLIKRQPEVLIEVLPGGVSGRKLRLLRKDWGRLSMLPAVRRGNIHFLTDDFLLIPSIRITQTARRFAEIIHPEAFDE